MRLLSLVTVFLLLLSSQLPAVEIGLDSNVDKQLGAQRLDNSLRSIEWFTLEYLRKAEQAEMAADSEQADFFLQKADESDEKASKIRWRAIKAWYLAGRDKKAHEISLRAAHIAKVRAELVELRLHKNELDLERLLSHGKQKEKSRSVLDIYPSYEVAYKHYVASAYQLFLEWTEVASMYDEAESYEEAELYWQKSIDVMSFLFRLNDDNAHDEEIPYQTYIYDTQRALMRLENLQLSLEKNEQLELTRHALQSLEKLNKTFFPEVVEH
ncbi:MAG: hypothetical protein KDI30_08795 [Pseudomonadales bacterium]|nr:hypothetical protein [Pseudomonadales bacterium]